MCQNAPLYTTIIFPRYLAIILITCIIRFTLKKIRSELLSSFEIMPDSEEGYILFLQPAVMLKTKIKNERKRKYWVPEFFRKREEKGAFNN